MIVVVHAYMPNVTLASTLLFHGNIITGGKLVRIAFTASISDNGAAFGARHVDSIYSFRDNLQLLELASECLTQRFRLRCCNLTSPTDQ